MDIPKKTQKNLLIRYVKLHFTIRFVEETDIPVTKASAIRGGMGQMLLAANCVRDRKCETCDFKDECIVQRMMYSKMAIQPEFMSQGDSAGYIIECTDYHNRVNAGDTMEFTLTLFGKNIVYFSQYLNAFYALGQAGLGREHARFEIISVTNSQKKPIMDGNNIMMANYKILTVLDYACYRMAQINQNGPFLIKFQTPLTVKYNGEIIETFDSVAIGKAIQRRIYMMDCFENIETDIMERPLDKLPGLEVRSCRNVEVKRYSERKDEKNVMKGIEGEIILKEMDPELLPYLIAGEILHIGKNTSFGFGRYIVKSID